MDNGEDFDFSERMEFSQQCFKSTIVQVMFGLNGAKMLVSLLK